MLSYSLAPDVEHHAACCKSNPLNKWWLFIQALAQIIHSSTAAEVANVGFLWRGNNISSRATLGFNHCSVHREHFQYLIRWYRLRFRFRKSASCFVTWFHTSVLVLLCVVGYSLPWDDITIVQLVRGSTEDSLTAYLVFIIFMNWAEFNLYWHSLYCNVSTHCQREWCLH